MPDKLLIVDDDDDMIHMLKKFFTQQNFLVYTAGNGEEAIRQMKVQPDLILLDINMPRLDGMEVCKRIRSVVHVPILFLTAKLEEEDKINGFLAGGDDYITKPFSLKELHARVNAHLRREMRSSVKADVWLSRIFSIDYTARTVFFRDTEVKMTKTEFDIMEILSMNQGHIFSKEVIYEKLWGIDKDGDSNIITEHIRRIRNKLAKYDSKELIETVWGVGYRWIG